MKNHPEALEKLKTPVETLATYLAIKDDPQPADAIFILGGSSLMPVIKAAELYHGSFSNKIVFISQGGKFGGESIWGMSEVDMYLRKLKESGVPDDAIIAQKNPNRQTRNTLEEAKAAVPFMNENGLVPKRLILTSRPVHQRRAFLTFSQQYPEIEYINCPADERINYKNVEDVVRVLQEVERLLDYGVAKNDIRKPEICFQELKAAANIRKELRDFGLYNNRSKMFPNPVLNTSKW